SARAGRTSTSISSTPTSRRRRAESLLGAVRTLVLTGPADDAGEPERGAGHVRGLEVGDARVLLGVQLPVVGHVEGHPLVEDGVHARRPAGARVPLLHDARE